MFLFSRLGFRPYQRRCGSSEKDGREVHWVLQSKAGLHHKAAGNDLPVHRLAETGKWVHRGSQSLRSLLAGRVMQCPCLESAVSMSGVCGVHV